MIQEFIKYLESNDGFIRFMKAWKKQYQKLGHLGGTIVIKDAEDNEKEAIGGLLGKDFEVCKDIKVSYSQLKKAIMESKFYDTNFEEILFAYFGMILYQNKVIKEQENKQRDVFFKNILVSYKDTFGYRWLQNVMQIKNHTYRNLVGKYNENRDLCKSVLDNVMKALKQLDTIDENGVSIAVFANQVTGDPHYFDSTTSAFSLLIQALCYYKKQESLSLDLYQKNEILYEYGLLINDLANNNFVCHILAKNNTEVHPGWLGFYMLYEPMNITLSNLKQINSLDTNDKTIFIVENPSVFSVLCSFAKKNKYQDVGFVCTNGQLNFSAYKLLDLLASTTCQMYYCGDFDPEGLLIANTLKERYDLCLWHYSKEDYAKSISQKEISDSRLSKLTHCHIPELQEIKGEILELGYSGYQEALIEEYCKDMENMIMK